MDCCYQKDCGGCELRHMPIEEYKKYKIQQIQKILSGINQTYEFCTPVFIEDGQRRRATFAFAYRKQNLLFGFNRRQSSEIIDIEHCCLLTSKINDNLENIKILIQELCQVKQVQKRKNKIIGYSNINQGDVWVTEADNGLDIVLEFSEEISLEHRLIISEHIQKCDNIIRISHRRNPQDKIETIIEKSKPYIIISGYHIYIPAGTFLQASKQAEQKMIDIVQCYLGQSRGKTADLFCGVGTFSYPMSLEKSNKIISIDSSSDLLHGFRESINKNMISNIQIEEKNLFKYPLDVNELRNLDILVFDPPRAGAEAQVKQIALLKKEEGPKKIIAVSCNPHSFVRDANILITGGYKLEKITLVDQFVYSNHSELVALFTK